MPDLSDTACLAWTWAQEMRVTDSWATQLCCAARLDHLTRHHNPNIRRLASDAARVVAETVSGGNHGGHAA